HATSPTDGSVQVLVAPVTDEQAPRGPEPRVPEVGPPVEEPPGPVSAQPVPEGDPPVGPTAREVVVAVPARLSAAPPGEAGVLETDGEARRPGQGRRVEAGHHARHRRPGARRVLHAPLQ